MVREDERRERLSMGGRNLLTAFWALWAKAFSAETLVAITFIIAVGSGISCGLQLRDAVAFEQRAMSIAALRAFTLRLQLDEETGVRGYSAARLKVLLEPYTAAERDIYGSLVQLRSAAFELGIPAGQEIVADMLRLHDDWKSTVAMPLAAGRINGREAGRIQLEGKRLIDAYRADNDRLAASLSIRFKDHINSAARQFVRIAIVFISSAVLCALAAAFVARKMQGDSDRARAGALLREDEIRYGQSRLWLRSFQRAILPPRLPSVPGCTFDAVYEASENDAHIGGDWYDAVRLVDGRILVSIGDVAGSGIEAAVVMGSVRQIMRGIAQVHANPALMLDAADSALRLEYPDVFVTAWAGVIDLVTHALTYASAGHPPPLVGDVDGTLRELSETALPLGLREGHQATSSTITLNEGSTLVLYTDGLSEATRDALAGNALVRAATRAVAVVPGKHSAAAIQRHVLPNGSSDDVAILVVRVNFGAVEELIERRSFDVSDVDAARAARDAFVRALQRRQFSPIETLNGELVFGELIGNVVRHAGAKADVEVAIDCSGSHVVLHVLDRGPSFRHISRLPADPYSESGRGLFLIASMTHEFTVSERPDGGSHVRAVFATASSVRLAGQSAAASASDPSPRGETPAISKPGGKSGAAKSGDHHRTEGHDELSDVPSAARTRRKILR